MRKDRSGQVVPFELFRERRDEYRPKNGAPQEAGTPSATERAYRAIKALILEGDWAPGDHIDVRVLHDILDTSATPIREALYWLVGEGLVEIYPHEGFRLPNATMWGLRDLLDWNRSHLVAAVGRIARTEDAQRVMDHDRVGKDDDLALDVLLATERLFSMIGALSGDREIYRAIVGATDRLHPFRQFEGRFIGDLESEAQDLRDRLARWDFVGLERALIAFHEVRGSLVGELVGLLHNPSRQRC